LPIGAKAKSGLYPIPTTAWRSGYFRKFDEQFFANLPESEDEDEEDEAELVEKSGVNPTGQKIQPWWAHP
jgi:hypothetical protein